MKSSDLISRLEKLKTLGGHPRFYELLLIIAEVHANKNNDYAGNENPLANLKGSEKFGIPAWKGALIRMGDKWDRLVRLASGHEARVKNESISDTLIDMAVYSLLDFILLEESLGNKK